MTAAFAGVIAQTARAAASASGRSFNNFMGVFLVEGILCFSM
jgi:hypothetical protein